MTLEPGQPPFHCLCLSPTFGRRLEPDDLLLQFFERALDACKAFFNSSHFHEAKDRLIQTDYQDSNFRSTLAQRASDLHTLPMQTTLNLDDALLMEASAVAGIDQPSQLIHAALGALIGQSSPSHRPAQRPGPFC